MSHNPMRCIVTACVAMPAFVFGSIPLLAQDMGWRVNKVSGDIWVTSSGVQQASLSPNAMLKPGDTIRTGRNGRVLLIRGTETILIAPNSAIGIPLEARSGLSTTIIQRAGSILLDVEKRSNPHFEVETPYLAAVVKGTQFRVTITNDDTSVDVLSGKVEVADFKSGQYAMTLPGQNAKVLLQGLVGLSLTGSGPHSPIQYGPPRTPALTPWSAPPEAGTPSSQAQNGSPTLRWGTDTPPTVLYGQALRARVEGSGSGYSGSSIEIGAAVKDWVRDSARGHRDENLIAYLAIPSLVGFTVSLGIFVRRRKKQRK
ncbi:MAG TPA: FecR family protein [Xanthobacteraceae bacterium]|nr:FecR family protein [Xanthobacteraceae bacterium]